MRAIGRGHSRAGPWSSSEWERLHSIGRRPWRYPVAAPFICGHGVVVEGVVVELGVVVVAVVDEPDGVLAAPDITDPIPSPNPNVPPATPSPSSTLLKGLISNLLLTKRQIRFAHTQYACCTSALY